MPDDEEFADVDADSLPLNSLGVATSNWQAMKGMEVLNPIFKGGDTLNLSSNN